MNVSSGRRNIGFSVSCMRHGFTVEKTRLLCLSVTFEKESVRVCVSVSHCGSGTASGSASLSKGVAFVFLSYGENYFMTDFSALINGFK